MSKTLFFLNGQPVILTNDGTDSLIPTNTALTAAIEESGNVESHDDSKGVIDPGEGSKHSQTLGSRLGESESIGDGLRSNFVQVKVNGREVPGFMLSQDKAGSVHKIIGQPLHHQKLEYDLLFPDKAVNVDGSDKGNEVESGGFLHFHNASVQTAMAKDSSFADGEESCGSDMFALAANTELLHTQVEGNSQEMGSVDSFQNLVRLPIVSNRMQVDAQSLNVATDQGQVMHVGVGADDSQVHQRNLSTIVAIIQGEDGSTQTIELSPEEACKLNLPQLLAGNVAVEQHPVHPHPDKIDELSTVHPNLGNDQKSQLGESESSTKGCSASVFQGEDRTDGIAGNGSCDVSTNDADVSLGPFLLIPEYNDDGSISILKIRGSDSDVTSEVSVDEPLNPNSVSVNNSHLHHAAETSDKTLLSFPRPGQSVQKISLPINTTQHIKKYSNIKPKHIDWKTVATKAAPKVPGSMYLRNIAKRTKFRNLTSFLDTKQIHQDCEVITKGHDIETVIPSTTFSASIAGLSNAASALPQTLVMTSSNEFSLGPGSELLNQSSPLAERKVTTQLSIEDMALHHPSTTASILHCETPPKLHQRSVVCSDRTLTIKVSTGPICVTGSTIHTTAPSTTPVPSIKCAEPTESLGSCSQSNSDSPSLTSIVYCSSGGDETPFTVHLPGGDNTKPLGSSENPIQLVQQGNTFQALQPVQERQLEQITALLQQRRITAPPTTHHDHHEIYDPKTNMKIVYKVVFPEDILHADDDDDDEGKDEDFTWEGRLGLLEEKRKGRKSKDWRKMKLIEEEEVDVEILDENEERKKLISRTRSGRISRPPRHMMKDFKHLHPINFNDDIKDKYAPGVGYCDYSDHEHLEPEEKPQPVYELPRRKKREVPALTRLRYTCLTCGKLYMGKIEAHYKKFPDHRRELPFSLSDLKQSYSAIKTLSDSAKPMADEGNEINKSVLSPTPGTQASETSGEPSLPMETLTTQPMDTQTTLPTQQQGNVHTPPFDVPYELTPVQENRGRSRRAKRGRRSRGRGSRVGSGARSASAGVPVQAPVPNPSPINMLEKILSGYSSEDIQEAVGKRLVQNFTPWQLLCFQAVGKKANGAEWSWQDRLCTLESLLIDCKEEFQRQMVPLQEDPYNDCHKQNHSIILNKELKHPDSNNMESGELAPGNEDMEQSSVAKYSKSATRDFHSLLEDEDTGSKHFIEKCLASMANVKVCDYLASVLGITSGVYKQREQLNVHSPPIPCAVVKRELEVDISIGEASNKRNRIGTQENEQVLDQKSSIILNTDQRGHCDIAGIDIGTYPKKPENDSVSKALEEETHNLDLSSYSLSVQMTSEPSLSPSQLQTSISSSPASVLTTSEGTTNLSTLLSSPHFSIPMSNECVSASNTILTMSHTAPCVAHTSAVTSVTSSLPLEVRHFSSHNLNSVSTISSCLPLSNIDASLIPTSTIPQVNTMQQMPLGDLDITAEDLPRLLSEGTGLVVGSTGDGGDACDAPKLLDTSGDTSDLSEMLFKLQEATVGISQNHDPNLGPPAYQEHSMTSSQVNANNNQLIENQSLNVHSGVALSSRGYSAVGQTNSHSAPNLSLKLDISQPSSEPSMPILTFTGALDTNSGFSNSSLNQAINGNKSSGKVQHALLERADDQQQNVSIDQNETSLESDRERVNIGFSVSALGSNEFEDLLKR